MAQNSTEEKPLLSTQSTLKEHLEQTLTSTTNTNDDDEKTGTNSFTCGETGDTSIDKHSSNITFRDFFTEYGRMRVTIEGDLQSGRPVIMTYHDIGINHVACFQSFFSIVSTYPNILRYFVVIHIDAPGHHYDTTASDAQLNSNKNKITMKENKDTNEEKTETFEMSKLASLIETIVYELKIKRFFGFGVGAGCNVWLEYAKQNNTSNFDSNVLRGLILVNPTNADPSWSEWGVNHMFSFMGSKTQWLRNVFFGSMVPRYNGWEPLSEESREFILRELNKIDEDAAVKYFRGYIQRAALTKSDLRKVNCRCLILASEESKVHQKTLELQSQLPNNLVDFVKFDHGSFLMTESHPQQLIKPIQMFVESMGVSKLTMEMKYGKIKD